MIRALLEKTLPIIPVPQWHCYVRAMSALELLQYEEGLDSSKTKESMIANVGRLLLHTICDQQGQLILTHESVTTILSNTTYAEMVSVFQLAQEVNGLSEAAKKKQGKALNRAHSNNSSTTSS